ncbi:hypothetical protein ABZW11_30255 [Nonomuraea sp. NPDC004580]|uniref:hypothetical protein n=1 Tax=Nonomuraea sp. NPDC004580 TaxID=3154552 RepID=UPI0033B4B051
MRRGWIVAGVLALVAVPSVPVAATGVSLVLERVNGAEDVGKWVRTGDTQRFRVRVNGMARGARVAVAADPAEALTEVSCATPPGTKTAALSAASGVTAAVPAAGSTVSGTAAAADSAAAGAGSVAAGAGSGEAAAGSQVVPPVTSAGQSGAGGGHRAAEVGAVPVDQVQVTGRTVAAGALAARALTAAGAARMASSADVTSAQAVSEEAKHVQALPDGAVVPGARVCALGKVSGTKAVDVIVRAPEGAGQVVVAAVARMRDGKKLTTMSRTAAVQVRGPITGDAATFSGPAHRLKPADARAAQSPPRTRTDRTATSPATATAQSGVARASGTRAGAGKRARAGAVAGTGNQAQAGVAARPGTGGANAGVAGEATAGVAGNAGVSGDGAGAAALVMPEAVPAPGGASGSASGGVPGVAPSVAAGGVPGAVGGVVADGGSPGGEAPLPWEMGVRTKPVKPVAWVSPIDGPKAFPLVVAAIAVLMGGLWLVVTVQKWRNRRKVF